MANPASKRARESQATDSGSRGNAESRPNPSTNIELVIFGFLASLTLKAALDTGYAAPVTGATDWQHLKEAFFSNVSLQVLVFLATLVRFIYGAYRVSEVGRKLEDIGILAWIVPGLLVLFAIFYVTGLSVRSPAHFYFLLGIAHLVDLVCFIIPIVVANNLELRLRKVLKIFLGIDLLTIIVLGVILVLCASPSVSYWGASVMVIAAALDFIWNRRFYFYPDRWQSDE